MTAEISAITQFNSISPNGYNMTQGGEGVTARAPEVLKRMSEMGKARYQNPEYAAKMKIKTKDSGPKGAITRKAFYASWKGQIWLAARSKSDWLKNITIARQQPKTAEQTAIMVVAAKKVWRDPVHREKVNAAREAAQALLRQNPEWVAAKKAKMALAMKAKWQDPEYLAKMAKRRQLSALKNAE
jgi:hypothetical protein